MVLLGMIVRVLTRQVGRPYDIRVRNEVVPNTGPAAVDSQTAFHLKCGRPRTPTRTCRALVGGDEHMSLLLMVAAHTIVSRHASSIFPTTTRANSANP